MDDQGYFERLFRVVDGPNARFPGGNTPFQMISRLCEEAGELAREVNHFEGTGVKMQKHGTPDQAKLAKEVEDVVRAALSVARYYGIEDELKLAIDGSYERLKQGG